MSAKQRLQVGIRVAAGGGDRIKGFVDVGNLVEFFEATGFELVLHNHGRQKRNGFGIPRDKAQHGHVVGLSGDEGSNASAFHDEVETGANVALDTGENHRDVAEVLGEAEGAALYKAWLADQTDRLLVDQLTVQLSLRVAGHGAVGEDEVERVGAELGEELTRAGRVDDDLQLSIIERVAEEAELEIFGKRGDRSDAENVTVAAAAVLQRGEHFLAGFEDRVRIIQHHAALFGQNERFVLPVKKWTFEAFFQLFQLYPESVR